MSSLRFKVVDEAFNRKAEPVGIPAERPDVYYGKYVFDRQKMVEYLPADTFKALINAIDNKETLPRDVADSVAEGMKTLGHRQWRTPLLSLVSTAHRNHSRETRRLYRA